MSDNTFKLADNQGAEHDYNVAYFLGREGMQICGELGNLMKKYAPDNEDVSSAGVINLAADVLSMCNDEIIKFLIDKFLATTRRDGKALSEANFDIVFAGNYEELVNLVTKIFELNYGGLVKNFFTKMKGKLATLANHQNLKTS